MNMLFATSLVTYDGTNVVFSSADLVTLSVTFIAAGVVGVVVLFVITQGLSFIFGMFSKGVRMDEDGDQSGWDYQDVPSGSDEPGTWFRGQRVKWHGDDVPF